MVNDCGFLIEQTVAAEGFTSPLASRSGLHFDAEQVLQKRADVSSWEHLRKQFTVKVSTIYH